MLSAVQRLLPTFRGGCRIWDSLSKCSRALRFCRARGAFGRSFGEGKESHGGVFGAAPKGCNTWRRGLHGTLPAACSLPSRACRPDRDYIEYGVMGASMFYVFPCHCTGSSIETPESSITYDISCPGQHRRCLEFSLLHMRAGPMLMEHEPYSDGASSFRCSGGGCP